MARSKSDISNSAIRIFLQDVGKFYDQARGFDPFVPKKKQKQELLEHFGFGCCYCGRKLDVSSLSQDHLIPMNKTFLGLHAWGNVVPCCQDCNNKKQQTIWEIFIKEASNSGDLKNRTDRIKSFVREMRYDPNLNLHSFADNLYEDVGEVAMTLVNLRYKQAEDEIRRILGK